MSTQSGNVGDDAQIAGQEPEAVAALDRRGGGKWPALADVNQAMTCG